MFSLAVKSRCDLLIRFSLSHTISLQRLNGDTLAPVIHQLVFVVLL
jgi:hypothetical protein